MIKEGIVYVARGQRYVDEALNSAKSVRKVMSKFPITLFTDQEVSSDLFDNIIQIDKPHQSRVDKINAIISSPYQKTLFLDTDTYMAESCAELFDLVDHYDMAMVYAQARYHRHSPTAPDCIPAFNSGVIAYNKTEPTQRLLNDWLKLYKDAFEKASSTPPDQHALREAIMKNLDCKIWALPNEYNVFLMSPGFLGGNGTVKILHGRRKNMPSVLNALNYSSNTKVFLPSLASITNNSLLILSKNGQRILTLVKKILKIKF
jgi:hypothetical protein